MRNIEALQNMVLSSFLFATSDLDEAFILDTGVFNTPFQKRVAEVINEETNGLKCYGYQMEMIELASMGTKFELEYLDIISAMPMPFSATKRYYDKLVELKSSEILGDL